MKKPWWIAAGLAWAGVVAIVALLAWWVIDSAGEGILANPAHDAVTPPTAPTTTTTEAPATRPSAPRTRTSPSPPGPTPLESEASAPSSPPPTSAAPDATPDAPESTSDPAPVTQTRSWQGEPGLVRVSCTGSQLRLEGASPADGYEVDTNTHRGGSELEVEFRSRDGDRRVEIYATCAGGTPQFRVEND